MGGGGADAACAQGFEATYALGSPTIFRCGRDREFIDSLHGKVHGNRTRTIDVRAGRTEARRDEP
jgi:hypothetical protein